MNKQIAFRICSWMLTFVGVATVLRVVRVNTPELPVAEVAGQYHYLWQASIVFVVCTCGTLFFKSRKQQGKHPDFYYAVVWCLILLGGMEALAGLRQLYGFTVSNHSLYAMTGSFFNPGPYSGYLALVFPLCLHEWLNLKKRTQPAWMEVVGKYISLAVMLLIVCLLPAGMSRSAWLAALVSGVWVYGVHAGWGARLRLMWKSRRKWLVGGGLTLLLGLLAVGFLMFHLKKDSASGRLLMWKMSCRAVAERPFTGYGRGSFAEAYGAAQENFFAQGDYSLQEELVAGSPEYAFNEYLQIAVEWGVPMLLVVLLLTGFCLYRGIRASRLGVCGAIISLLVFAFSSYPLQLPAFIVTLGALLLACVVGQSRKWVVTMIVVAGLFGLYCRATDDYKECRSWTNARMLYQMGAYTSAAEEYEQLYPSLKGRGAFLFEYGHCLHKMKKYEPSTQILREAMTRTCDPMVLNIIGKNCQEQGDYLGAEEWLIRSTHLLPGRIYPYYLLAKLYAEPGFYHPDKLKAVAEIVLVKEPKVQSTAIKEMRNEVKKLIKEIVL